MITFLKRFYDSKVNGRVVARVFHGLSSPAFPAMEWARNSFWGRYKEFDFNKLLKLATEEIVQFKAKGLHSSREEQ